MVIKELYIRVLGYDGCSGEGTAWATDGGEESDKVYGGEGGTGVNSVLLVLICMMIFFLAKL